MPWLRIVLQCYLSPACARRACGRSNVSGTPDLIQTLPAKLRTEVTIFLKKRVIDEIPLLSVCATPLSQIALVQCLTPEIALPSQMVCRQGEFGDCMFFLMRGELHAKVWVSFDEEDDGEEGSDTNDKGVELSVASIKEPGEYFGEACLLDTESRRVQSVVAVGFTELMRLGAEEFYPLIQEEPIIFEIISKASAERAENVKQKVEDIRKKERRERFTRSNTYNATMRSTLREGLSSGLVFGELPLVRCYLMTRL
jgi:CRP-like cAMP-binding protein